MKCSCALPPARTLLMPISGVDFAMVTQGMGLQVALYSAIALSSLYHNHPFPFLPLPPPIDTPRHNPQLSISPLSRGLLLIIFHKRSISLSFCHGSFAVYILTSGSVSSSSSSLCSESCYVRETTLVGTVVWFSTCTLSFIEKQESKNSRGYDPILAPPSSRLLFIYFFSRTYH